MQSVIGHYFLHRYILEHECNDSFFGHLNDSFSRDVVFVI